jgi:hypothetical protein
VITFISVALHLFRWRSIVSSQAVHRTTEGRRYILSLNTKEIAAQLAKERTGRQRRGTSGAPELAINAKVAN